MTEKHDATDNTADAKFFFKTYPLDPLNWSAELP